MKSLFRLCGVISIFLVMGCEQQTTAAVSSPSQAERQLAKDFEVWKRKQNQNSVQKYQQYLAKNLKNPPNLLALSYNVHIRKPECMQYRFALAPEKQWKNVIEPLKLLEKLQKEKVIEQYKIVSVYRSEKANQCSKGATKSKHLNNYAIDFQIFDAKGKPYAATDFKIQKALCKYWKQHGKRLKLGLGTYGQYKFHVDLQGYRTWGANFKRDSSACVA